jgi:hypothetical protein
MWRKPERRWRPGPSRPAQARRLVEGVRRVMKLPVAAPALRLPEHRDDLGLDRTAAVKERLARVPGDTSRVDPDLRLFIDRALVPALLERFLREHAPATRPSSEPQEFPKAEATV